AGAPPPLYVRRTATSFGEPDRAVEGDPALHPAVGEVLATAAGFPDALIGLVPVVAQPVDHVRGSSPALIGGLQATGVDLGDRVQRLAVDVELELVGGPIPDSHRPGAAPAFEVVERLLGQVGAPVNPVHDLHRWGAVAAVLD